MKMLSLVLIVIACFSVAESAFGDGKLLANLYKDRLSNGDGITEIFEGILNDLVQKAIQCRKDNADDIANVNGDFVKEVVQRWKDQTLFKPEDDTDQGAMIRKAIAAYKNQVNGVEVTYEEGSEEGAKIKAMVAKIAEVVTCLKEAAATKVAAAGVRFPNLRARFRKNKAAADAADVPE
ncbi:uncharacterized protein LOC134819726 isoform X1 [Bolinopsis microptera]|uniref:uncharacterized protein LOC134819726 isoform X1 n=1 Tax=Bolinopsis microptera TaxID=2820187 RepID=UPI00307AE291